MNVVVTADDGQLITEEMRRGVGVAIAFPGDRTTAIGDSWYAAIVCKLCSEGVI